MDVVLFDIGDTLVRAAPGGTPTADLVAEPLPGAQALRRSVRLGAVTDTDVMTADQVRNLLDPVRMSDETMSEGASFQAARCAISSTR